MRQFLYLLFFFALSTPALAWNAAGHRQAAIIAWQQLSPPARAAVERILASHPDYERWQEKAGTRDGMAVFAEASTWPDDIRKDPRFYDEARETATPPLPGLPDTARHKRWHYVDMDPEGRVETGELDRQIERLSRLLRPRKGETASPARQAEISYALPWLAHLVADIHQPLHVGRHDDEGGNRVAIENPFNRRRPFGNLHAYWDDLPGPPWLRGKRLEKIAAYLIDNYPPPEQGNVALWRDESHRLLARVYPDTGDTPRPRIDERFQRQARDLANRRVVDAGYRLGRLLDSLFGQPNTRESQ